ncbi:MAG: IS3 family transposase [Oscillospiraceae bacterium]|nr:IS3 family transposase [Oscillospiraceae bacterium]
MKTKLPQKQKHEMVKRYFNGEPVQAIAEDVGISRSTLYSWINDYKAEAGYKEISLQKFNTTLRHAEYLEKMVCLLQELCASTTSLKERLCYIETLSSEYPVNLLCKTFNVAKGTYYNHTLRNKRENSQFNQKCAMLRPIIKDLYDESHQIFGATKITAILNDRGYHVAFATVSKLMQEMELYSIRNGAKSYYEQSKRKKRENILQQSFTASAPNKVWVSDVTQFTVKNFRFYICAIIDIFSRKVVSYHISKNNSTQLTKTTFKKAYESRHPDNDLLFHTDNGSNYISATFMKYLDSLGVKQSFSRAHIPYDNSVCESFFSSLKREELYRYKYPAVAEFKRSVEKYINFFNNERPHASIRYKTPNAYEKDF